MLLAVLHPSPTLMARMTHPLFLASYGLQGLVSLVLSLLMLGLFHAVELVQRPK